MPTSSGSATHFLLEGKFCVVDLPLSSKKNCPVSGVRYDKEQQRRVETMISRIWHGWTIPARADAYEELLKREIFAGIQGRRIPGFQSIQLFRRDLGGEVEFVTVMWFDSLESVRIFAGDDYEAAVVPPAARALLARFDARSQHYEVRESLKS
jgi:heme-degrading monooxygenase HmoA